MGLVYAHALQLCGSVDLERCNDRSSWRLIMATCLAPRSSSLFKENFMDSADACSMFDKYEWCNVVPDAFGQAVFRH